MAGEAGREMLTVLAQPRTVEINGISAVIGKAGQRQLAIVDAAALGGTPHRMATGGIVGAQLHQRQQSSNPNGNVNITVGLSPDLEARIIKTSIEGATVRVEQDLTQNSRISKAVKGIR